MEKIKFYWNVLKETVTGWTSSSATRDSASLAYYSIFSIPGLLIIIIWIAGAFFGEEAIRGEITGQISSMMGNEAAESVQSMIANAMIDRQSFIMKTVGVLSLIFGATTVFFQLQKSLNNLWEVEPVPNQAITKFLKDRFNSLGMIVIIGFLLMITMFLSSAISFLNTFISNQLGYKTYLLMEAVNYILGLGIVIVIFGLIFKVLPDAQISYKAVWPGAILTALLFTIGKFLLGLYFSELNPTSVFGTAGTVILIMMWINYSCMLVLFGAEFTKVYSKFKGYKFQPAHFSKWTDEKLYEMEQKEKTEGKDELKA